MQAQIKTLYSIWYFFFRYLRIFIILYGNYFHKLFFSQLMPYQVTYGMRKGLVCTSEAQRIWVAKLIGKFLVQLTGSLPTSCARIRTSVTVLGNTDVSLIGILLDKCKNDCSYLYWLANELCSDRLLNNTSKL